MMRNDHPLAKLEEVDLEEIKKHNVVRIDKSQITLPLFEQISKEFNLKTNIEFENANWEIIKHYVKAGIGVGFVSEICMDNNEDELVYKKLNKYFPVMDYHIAIKKGKRFNEGLADFVKIIDPSFPVNNKNDNI